MNKTEGEMKQLVEASGGCWHSYLTQACIHCGKPQFLPFRENPSPNDLNTLFDIAEKLGFADVEMAWTFTEWRVIIENSEAAYIDTGQTRGDALRTVLIKSL